MNLVRLIPSVSLVLLVAVQVSAFQSSPQVMGRFEAVPSAESISMWEGMSQADPNNSDLRTKLLAYYSSHGPVEKYFQQELWMVQHHPESPMIGFRSTAAAALGNLPEADLALVNSAWEQAIIDQADNGKVLYNAGVFFMKRDLARAAQLVEEARQLEPENQEILATEADLYVSAFAITATNPPNGKEPENEKTLRAEIAVSTDPPLLTEVGSKLIRLGNSDSKAKGTELINRAISLDPTNERWKAALRAASFPPPPPPPPPPSQTQLVRAIRIGGKVAEANLIRKVDPVYPDLALRARVSGTIEFTATINGEGHIQNLQLVRGHPLLVNAAKQAVLQYLYRPTLMNGNPVSVITSISVPFELPQQ